MDFIFLTGSKNIKGRMVVSIKNITSIYEWNGSTIINFIGDDNFVSVQEPLEHVENLLRLAKEDQ